MDEFVENKKAYSMRKTNMLFFIFFWWSAFQFSFLLGQESHQHSAIPVFTIKKWENSFNLKKEIGICQDEGLKIGVENVEKVLKLAPFQAFDQVDFELKPQQYYWGQLRLKNSLPDASNFTEWVLHFNSTLTEIDLFIQQTSGSYEKSINGEFVSFHLKAFKPLLKKNLVRVTLAPEQPIQIYFRAQSTKPFHKEELLIRLEKLTELRKALQARFAQVHNYRRIHKGR